MQSKKEIKAGETLDNKQLNIKIQERTQFNRDCQDKQESCK